ncbi:MAG: hypothetical protein ABIJ30_12120 [bacterium]
MNNYPGNSSTFHAALLMLFENIPNNTANDSWHARISCGERLK